MEMKEIELSSLQLAHEDKKHDISVRKRGRDEGVAEMMHMIEAAGLLVPLLVRTNGKGFVVADGNRRLQAIRALDAEKKWPGPVPCVVMGKESDLTDAREAALMTSMGHLPPHECDQLETFASLHKDGRTVAQIASRFGLDDKRVNRILSLGNLHPKIRQAWRDNAFENDELECVRAFTMAKDQAEQEVVFDRLKKQKNLTAYSIRNALGIGNKDDVAKLVLFVGREAYEAAGGKMTEDLFAVEDNQIPHHRIHDPKIAIGLASEKMSIEIDKLLADGWAWAAQDVDVKDRHSLNRIDHGGRTKFTAEEKKSSGCILSVDHKGGLQIEMGYLKKGQKASGKKSAATSSTKDGKKKAAPAELSGALEQRLREQQAAATKMAIAITIQSRGKDKLFCLFAHACNELIDAARPQSTTSAVQDILDEVRDLIDPDVMQASFKKHFDAADYFDSAPKALVLDAIAEVLGVEESRKLKDKTRGDVAKFAKANVAKTNWLPEELQTSNYKLSTKKRK